MNDCVVIIPTYNEKENIEDIIQAVFAVSMPFDIIVIDDNSPDGTAGLVKNFISPEDKKLYLVERHNKLGLGTAYIEAFRIALEYGYKYILEMDADFSHDPKDLIRLCNACINDGYDIAIGSRYITGVNVVNWPLSRVLLSLSAGVYVRWITGMPIADPTAGFVCYKRKVLETINLSKVKFIGYAFQIEMKYLAWRAGFNIKELPIIFTDRIRGKSKMSIKIFREAFLGVWHMRLSNFHKKLHEVK